MDLIRLYGFAAAAQKQQARLDGMRIRFDALFGAGEAPIIVSAPGRTEIGGNHTDHNHGCVLAASVDMDTLCLARANGTNCVTLCSDMYDEPFRVDLSSLEPRPEEKETTQSLIRGVAAALRQRGMEVSGFDAYVTSTVQRGSGLSSSAAFEVMLVKTMSCLFGGDAIAPQDNAVISQWVENTYFMKPCGLMDQMASAVGGLVFIDFKNTPAQVESVQYDFTARGLGACVVSAGGDHGNLTADYAAIPAEMKAVAKILGGETLRDVEDKIEGGIGLLKGKVPDRAILRALHFVDENVRVRRMVEALKKDDVSAFLENVILSGESSWKLLQNLYVPGSDNQEMPLALEMSRRFLQGRGAWRIHGGGFAGTILAFVPLEDMPAYTACMKNVFGAGAVKPLYIRPEGAVRL